MLKNLLLNNLLLIFTTKSMMLYRTKYVKFTVFTHYLPMFPFYTLSKHQKTRTFLIVLHGIERNIGLTCVNPLSANPTT